jgi:RNA polymerase sigma factor (sigma-70 family)
VAAVPSIGRAVRVDGAPAPEADLTRALYEQYANQIFRYCLHQLGSREEAEDAVQSTFLNAFRGIKRGVVPELESAWLFKIAHNVCLSRRRTSWRRGRIESPTDFGVVEELTPAPSRRADELIGLQDVLEQMPDNQRRAILLREWQGLSYREIADELELSQAAVETLIFRARRALAAGLEQPPQPKRRIVRGADIGNVLAGLKSLLLGGGAAVKVAATVAVVSAGTVVAAAPVQQHRPPMHPPAPVSLAPPSATTSAPSGPVESVVGPSTAFPAKSAAHPRARSRLQRFAALAFALVTGSTTSETVAVQAAPEATAPAAGTATVETPAAPAVPSAPPAATQPADAHTEPQHGPPAVSTPVPVADKAPAEKSKTETSSGQGSASGGGSSSQPGAATGAKGGGDAKATSDSKSNSDSKSSPDTNGKGAKGGDGEQRKSSSVAGTTTLPLPVSASPTTTTTQSSTTQSTTTQSTTTQSAGTSPPSGNQPAVSQSSDSNGGDSKQSDSQKDSKKKGAWLSTPTVTVTLPAVTVTLPVATVTVPGATVTPPAGAPPAVQTTAQTVPTPTWKGKDTWKGGGEDNHQGGDH